jgi:hypothetical protein
MTVEEWDRAHLWNFRARLVRVVDADTIKVLSDTGYRGRHEPALRLHRVFAPKASTYEGAVAATWLGRVLGNRPQGGTGDGPPDVPPLHREWPLRVKTVQRETVVEETTTFERWVSDVWLAPADPAADPIPLNDLIVDAGHARRTDA